MVRDFLITKRNGSGMKLKKIDIKIDVEKNPLSVSKGFSKAYQFENLTRTSF